MSDFPLKLTEAALKQALHALQQEAVSPNFYLTVGVKGGGCSGMQHTLAFSDEVDEDYLTQSFTHEGATLKVAIDNFSALYLQDVTMDYVSENMKEGFKFTGGAQKKTCACGSSFSV